ncbi:MAG: AAA family ATPase [Candidatus Hydrogenedentes bacterium]|nr:AAA family ATPase [Candidatus Hydrogenedentota bacterium]
MKFTEVWINGYGRFTSKHLELTPGLQIIAGPNEQGKSTIRHFLGDMLYGQKRNPNQRIYDESNKMRAPWQRENGYGGRIHYTLDSGRLIEIQRSFDRKDESVQVFDRTDAQDITRSFPMLKNREPTFAEAHLKMSKAVFLGMATISHGTLEELGDRQTLAGIRDKLISLSDSGSGQSSTESAIDWLKDRIAAIGQQTARTKPLPMARARLTDLQKEYEHVRALRDEMAELERERRTVLDACETLRASKIEIETQLADVEQGERAERLTKAETLLARMDTITKECFGLGAARDFPLDLAPEIQRITTLLSTAAQQSERMQTERAALEKQLDDEIQRLGEGGAVSLEEGDPELENELTDFTARINRVQDRIEETERVRMEAEKRHLESQNALAKLPDFTKLASDPVEWLTQLASSFSVAQRARDTEDGQRTRLGETLDVKRAKLEESDDVFEDCGNFLELLRRYESRGVEHSFDVDDLDYEVGVLKREADVLNTKVPGFTRFAVISLVLAGVMVAVAWRTGNPGVFIPAGIAGLMVVLFSGCVIVTRYLADQKLRRMHLLLHEKENLAEETPMGHGTIETLMLSAGCQTIRELEALYEQYRDGQVELAMLEEQFTEQNARAKEANERVRGMFAHLSSTFVRMGQELDGEDDVQKAAMRGIARYQEYRESKRRGRESRETLEQIRKEMEALTEQLETLQKDELTAALAVRQFLRENHYLDENKYESALEALRAYKRRNTQMRQRQSQVDRLQGKLAVTDQQIESENARALEQNQALAAHLGRARVATVEEFEAKAEQARLYEDRRKELSIAEEQLAAILGNEDIKALRESVGEDTPTSELSGEEREKLKRNIKSLAEEVDAKQKQSHALHIAITEHSAGARSINEVDEERDATERRVQELELEMQAAVKALVVLDEVTRERHSQIAPRLGELASRYLSTITDGAYTEILVSREMKISVRIPQTKTLNEDPEKRLSKGTVDQIYLALRLAMVECASAHNEKIPMLLDDPFANYDDDRLDRAMKLLQEIGQTSQILLFTCRDDVVQAGSRIGTEVLYL